MCWLEGSVFKCTQYVDDHQEWEKRLTGRVFFTSMEAAAKRLELRPQRPDISTSHKESDLEN